MAKELTKEELLRLYREMVLIRRFEEKSAELYAEGKIGGFLHLYIGEEAIAAGACQALRDERPPVDRLSRSRLGHLPRAGSEGGHGRAAGQGHRRLRRQGRLDAPGQRRTPLLGRPRDRRRPPAAGDGRRAGSALQREARGGAVRPGRRHHQHRLFPRVGEPGGRLEAAGRLPRREQPVRHGHRGRPGVGGHRTSSRRAAPTTSRTSSSTARTSSRSTRRSTRRWSTRARTARCCWRPMTYRYVGHSMGDPERYRTKAEIEEWRRARPDPAPAGQAG